MTPTIARFDPAAHDLASFRCGVADVDSFFTPRPKEYNFRHTWEQRIGDMCVALDDGQIVGAIAYTASSVPPKATSTVADDFRNSGRKGASKPLELALIPAVRIIILGVRPARQRRGIGSALVRHALAAVTAPVYYLRPQHGSEGFYANLGFVEKFAGSQKLMVHIPQARTLRRPPAG